MDGKTLVAAAAAAGMCERTARRWQDGPWPSAMKTPRTWRTRSDPFAEVWASEVVPRLAADEQGRLQALTLFDWLCDRYPGRFQPGQVRTFQRRGKPGAFARYRYREELFPSLTFRQAYDALGVTHGERADVEYVRLLHLAATTSERQVEATLVGLRREGQPFDYAGVQAVVSPALPRVPAINIPMPDLAQYDALLVGGGDRGLPSLSGLRVIQLSSYLDSNEQR